MMTGEESIYYELKVKNAFKSYDNNKLMNGLNMNVTSSSIYALLGPSGCGKSTLLQCILGINTLDSGYADLKADSLSDIGYMPQDLCLEGELTIKELFEYYGSIYNMEKSKIESKVDELTQTLQLPNINSYINELSGGQYRRVSLALALLHDPKIIILDEPTVGIDPLLRHEIWKEFKKMVQQNQKTIIITTHYIEEANEANCVGLMRNGVIVDEGSPEYIITKYDTDTLESAFLKLCQNQKSNDIANNIDQEINEYQSKNLMKTGQIFAFNRIKAILKKNSNVYSRDYALLATTIFIPIMQSFLYCYSVGVNINGIKIAIKNDEINIFDCQYYNLNGCILDNNDNHTLSCVVINYFTSLNYKLMEVEDINAGESIVNNYDASAFIHFPKKYSRQMAEFIDNRNNYDPQSQAYIHFNNDNFIIKNTFLTDTMKSIKFSYETILNKCSINRKSFDFPLDIETYVGKEVKSTINSTSALCVIILVFHAGCMFSLSMMISEKCDGTFVRSIFAGCTVIDLQISLFCVANLVLLINLLIHISIVYVFFLNPIQLTSGLITFTVLMFLMGWFGFFLGLLIVGISSTKTQALTTLTGCVLGEFLLSGLGWPVEGQVPLLRAITQYFPIQMGGKTVTDIALKGWTLDHPSIITGTTMLLAYNLILVTILIGLGKFKKDMWIVQK